MKYESDSLRISDQDEDIDPAIDKQISDLKDKIANIFMAEEVRHDVALSVLATMYVVTCRRVIEMPKEIALEAIKGAIEMQYAEDEDMSDEEMHFATMEKPKWLKLTAEQRIEKTHVALMRHRDFCLFSGLFMVGKVTVDEKTPTAKTNGVDVIYGRGFVDSLNDKQLGFLILHETMHKAYRHLHVWKPLYKKNAQLANMACDYVINLQIRDYDLHENTVSMPVDADGEIMGCLDERFRGMDAHQVFTILEKEQQGGSGGKGGENGEGQRNYTKQDGDAFDDHDWEGAEELTDQEKEQIAKEIEGALRQGAILAGKMGGNVNRDIQGLLTPKVNWRDALRDFVKTATQGKDQTTWRRLHKRYIGMDIIMPSSYDEKVGSILLGIDTSGSIGGEELAQFLGEVKSICDEVSPEQIDLLYWDTRVAGHEVYRGAELASLVEVTQAKGGGGTSPECVPHYIKKKQLEPECVIMLTDGYINRQDPNDWQIGKPILWCIKGNTHFSGDDVIGKVVHVE